MANAFSTIRRYAPYVDPIDNNRIRQVLAAKQQNFDSNIAEVSGAIESFGNIDLIREQDRQMLMDNLQKVVEITDNEQTDFSKKGVGNELKNYISQAITPEVLKQAGNTQNIRNYQSSIQQTKDENPGLYAQQNDWYATNSAGLTGYLNGESDNLGNLEYIPYNDYEKDLDKNLLTWAKEIGIDTFYEPGQTDGIKFMMEGTELKKSDVKDFLRSRLDQNAQNQIFIDNAYNYQNNSTEELIDTYKNYHSDLLDSTINRKSVETKILRQKGLNPAESPTIKALEEKEAFHKKEMQSNNLDRNSVTRFIGFESYLDRKSSVYADKDYTKVAPDNTDIRRVESLLKRQESKKSSTKSSGTQTGSNIPGTISPIETPTKDKENVIQSTLDKAKEIREEYLGVLFNANPEFEEKFQKLNSEEERNNAIQEEILAHSSVTIGAKANPEASRLASEYEFAAKNLSLVNDSYKKGIEVTADRIYQGLYDELQTEGQDFNSSGYAKRHPQTVKLLKEKGLNLSPKDREVIRYEYAQDIRDLSGLSQDAENAIDEYVTNQYQKVKDNVDIIDPEAKSATRKILSNMVTEAGNAFQNLFSGFDEEVIRENANEPREDVSFTELLGEIGDGLGAVGEVASLQPLFVTDEEVANLSKEDIQLKDNQGNYQDPSVFIKTAFEGIETTLREELESAERRLPQSFELTLDPTTIAKSPRLRSDIANFYSSKTGRNIKASERVSITINKKDRSAVITEIDEKEGLVPKQFRLEELPQSITDQFNTKQDEWVYNAENPRAVTKKLNFSLSLNRKQGYQHFDNLVNAYGVPNAIAIAGDKEAGRKKFAPTIEEVFNGLQEVYPDVDQQQINKLLLTPYEFEFYPNPNTGTYGYRIYDKRDQQKNPEDRNILHDMPTQMEVFNEGIAAANINLYLQRYFQSKLGRNE